MPESVLLGFSAMLAGEGLETRPRSGLIGDNASVDGPFGSHHLIYADYVASGRALQQIESFVLEGILPYYSNSHTKVSYCGSFCTRMRRAARGYLAAELGATVRSPSGTTPAVLPTCPCPSRREQMSDDKVDLVIDAVDKLSRNANDYRDHHVVDTLTAQFQPVSRLTSQKIHFQGEPGD